MSKVISIANFKGGVGKTTSTLNIGAGLHRAGKRVLMLDIDPQHNLTQSVQLQIGGLPIYHSLRGEGAIQPAQILERFDLVPSSLDLIKSEIELSGEFKREEILERLLKPIRDQYDYVLIDCPPSLGLLTINAFMASDWLFVPIEAEFLALKGYTILNEAIGRIGLQIDRAFVTKFDSRKTLNREVLEAIRGNLGDRLFKTVIRGNVSLAEAPSRRQDIFGYAPDSRGAEDYTALCAEILAIPA
jgi:chromosome partitioning protein